MIFFEQKKSSDYITFTDVFEFFQQLENYDFLRYTDVKNERLHAFTKHMGHRRKRGKKGRMRVEFETKIFR